MQRLEPDLSESSRICTFYRINKKVECDERDVDSPLTIWQLQFPALTHKWKRMVSASAVVYTTLYDADMQRAWRGPGAFPSAPIRPSLPQVVRVSMGVSRISNNTPLLKILDNKGGGYYMYFGHLILLSRSQILENKGLLFHGGLLFEILLIDLMFSGRTPEPSTTYRVHS